MRSTGARPATARDRARGGATLIELSIRDARRLVVSAQLLDGTGPSNGTDLIGRVDATAERDGGVLRVDGVWAERGAPSEAGPDVARALRDVATWLGLGEMLVARRVPRAWQAALRA